MRRDKLLPARILPKVHFKDVEGLSDGQHFQIFRNQWVDLKSGLLTLVSGSRSGGLGESDGRLGGTAYARFTSNNKMDWWELAVILITQRRVRDHLLRPRPRTMSQILNGVLPASNESVQKQGFRSES
jgi:hypothetical protein